MNIGKILDQNLTSNFKNEVKLQENEKIFCIKTTSKKIVHYSAVYCVNLAWSRFRVFELLKIKSVKCFLTPNTWKQIGSTCKVNIHEVGHFKH